MGERPREGTGRHCEAGSNTMRALRKRASGGVVWPHPAPPQSAP
jgi:hypothetical protein